MQRLTKFGLLFNFFSRGEWVRTTPDARVRLAETSIQRRAMMAIRFYRPLVTGDPLRVVRTIPPDSVYPYGGNNCAAIVEVENGSEIMNLFDAEAFMPAWVTDEQYETWKRSARC